MAGTNKMEGFSELRTAIKELDNKVAKDVLRKALREGAKVYQRQAVTDAPVLTGETRKAVKVRAGKRKKDFISIIAGVGEGWFKGKTFYAAFVEFGHKVGKRAGTLRAAQRRERAGGPAASDGRKEVPGKHWMEGAFKKVEDAVKQRILAAIQENMEQAVAEARKK